MAEKSHVNNEATKQGLIIYLIQRIRPFSVNMLLSLWVHFVPLWPCENVDVAVSWLWPHLDLPGEFLVDLHRSSLEPILGVPQGPEGSPLTRTPNGFPHSQMHGTPLQPNGMATLPRKNKKNIRRQGTQKWPSKSNDILSSSQGIRLTFNYFEATRLAGSGVTIIGCDTKMRKKSEKHRTLIWVQHAKGPHNQHASKAIPGPIERE